MRKELDEALVRDFPNLYRMRNGDRRSTAMCWGFSCGDGWEPLIRELSEKLENLIIKTFPDEDHWRVIDYRILFDSDEAMEASAKIWGIRNDPTWNEESKTYKINENPRHQIYASQVKEKFGTLRFYMSSATDEMWSLIEDAERKSENICEMCGEPGILRNGCWLRTLCDKDFGEST